MFEITRKLRRGKEPNIMGEQNRESNSTDSTRRNFRGASPHFEADPNINNCPLKLERACPGLALRAEEKQTVVGHLQPRFHA
jgi:hypothetical protein